MDRQAEFLRGRDHDAAARGAVEFRHDESGDARHLLEHLDLRQRILAGRGVEDEDDVMRAFGVDPAQHTANFREFIHQFALVVKPPGSVDDQDVDAGFGGFLDRVPDDARRVAALGPRDDGHADALRPRSEAGRSRRRGRCRPPRGMTP